MNNDQFIDFLTKYYALDGHSLQPLGQGAKQVYRVQRGEGIDWILRAFPTKPEGYLARGADDSAKVLLFLERYDYPTERVIRTQDGEATAKLADWALLVTTDVGQSLQAWVGELGSSGRQSKEALTPAIWTKLGVALARLHAIPIEATDDLPKAGMLPARELTWVAQHVAELADEVPSEWQPWYDELRTAIGNSHHCEDLERVLIHCDPNLGNAAINKQSDVTFIDWDVVGLGPAVFDLGCLLCNCIDKHLEPDVAAIQALIGGYVTVRPLSTVERERLVDTVSSQMLVTLGGYLPSVVRGEVHADEAIYGLTYAQWQAKYRASAKIAAIAQAHSP